MKTWLFLFIGLCLLASTVNSQEQAVTDAELAKELSSDESEEQDSDPISATETAESVDDVLESIASRSNSSNEVNAGEIGSTSKESPEVKIWFRVVLGVMIFFYFGETAFCISLGRQSHDTYEISLIGSIFETTESRFGFWAFIIMAFLCPFMLGTVPDIATTIRELVKAESLPSDLGPSTPHVLYTICTAILTVLITVEFTYLSNPPDNRVWQRMLVVALALDILTLIVLSLFAFDPSHRAKTLGPISLSTMSLATSFALVSSFMTVACVRELNNLNLKTMKAQLDTLSPKK